MGFRLSKWDEKLLYFSHLFEKEMMDLHVNCTLEQALDNGWCILERCFTAEEIGIKKSLIDRFWGKTKTTSVGA